MASRSGATTRAPSKVPAQAHPGEQEHHADRTVNGLKVIAVEDAHSPLSTPGRPIVYRLQVLTLEDNTVVYGCTDCPEEIFAKLGQGRQHRAAVHPGERRQQVTVTPDMGALTLAELVELAGQATQWSTMIDNITADRDRWRDLCRAADKTVASYIRAFDRLGFQPKVEDE